MTLSACGASDFASDARGSSAPPTIVWPRLASSSVNLPWTSYVAFFSSSGVSHHASVSPNSSTM